MSSKKSLYHVAIDGQGFALRGAAERPARTMEQAPLRGLGPAEEIIDLDYKDSSSFLPWAQSDWAGGFQDEQWKDNAAFFDGSDLEYIPVFGQVSLLNAISSDLKNFGTFSFGASQEFRDNLYIGNSALGGAELWKVSGSDVFTQVTTGWTTIGSVFDMEEHHGLLWLGLDTSGADSPLQTFDGGATFADITITGSLASSNVIRMVVRIGERIYIGGFKDVVGDGDALAFSDDDGATWTDLITNTGINRTIREGTDSLGILYILIEDGIQTELWQVNGTIVTQIYRWNNLLQSSIRSWNGIVYIRGIQDGKERRYKWDGSTLSVVFEERVSGLDLANTQSSPMIPWRENLHSYGVIYDGIINFPGFVYKESGNKFFPFAVWGDSANQSLYFQGLDTSGDLVIRKVNASAFQTSGSFTTGRFFASKIAVDKLWHSVIIQFEELAADETIQVEFSTDDGASFTSIGTITDTLAGTNTEFTLFFPENTTSRKIQLRVTLGGDGTSTPVVQAFNLRYLILGDHRFRWQLDLVAYDDYTLLDGRTEEQKRADELRQVLYQAQLRRQIVDFEDVDFMETKINDGSGLSAAATTVTVDNTDGFPEQGRIKINQEEIFYTSKTATSFKGLTRGARGTQPAVHADDDDVTTKYRVLVTGVNEINPVAPTNEPMETILGVTLLEV